MDAQLNSPLCDDDPMARALELAEQGEGAVEPNPMVGCVLVAGGEVVGEGFHERFGGPHAEVNALHQAGQRARGATAYVTLEPCGHHGKTPPCTEALLDAGVNRVLVAAEDPNPEVAGKGIERLRAAGVQCEVGRGRSEAHRLLAPYLKLTRTGLPWIIAKWAMSLDGKIATRSGDSQWISSEASRRWVHAKRGLVDAVVIGAGTLISDDPLLTARPPGPRTPARVVVADARPLSADRKLFHTLDEGPVLLFVEEGHPDARREELASRGVVVTVYKRGDIYSVFKELGRRRWTNVMVEGGGKLLGRLADERLLDEVHAFVTPRLIGGEGATSPVEGHGVNAVAEAVQLTKVHTERFGEDLHFWGRIG